MSNNASFLPEDYLAQKVERRTNIISLILFLIVMVVVLLAFLFTNQKWKTVRADQIAINTRYEEAAGEIRDHTELKSQRKQMIEKAELAAVLVERVPRSILLAELINRMPERLSLIEFSLKSEEIKRIAAPRKAKSEKSGRMKPKHQATKNQAKERVKKIQVPQYLVSLTLKGVAPGDIEVSRFMTELNSYSLFENVSLAYTEEKEVEGEMMREFKINMQLAVDADIRDIDRSEIAPRSSNPLTGDIPYTDGTSDPRQLVARGLIED